MPSVPRVLYTQFIPMSHVAHPKAIIAYMEAVLKENFDFYSWMEGKALETAF